MTRRRQEDVDRHGSPVYTYRPAAIAAGATNTIEVARQFPASGKYAPLDTTRIVNNSGVDIEVRINGRARTEVVPAGVMIEMSEQSVIILLIENEDGVTATAQDEITVLLSRAPLTADELARRYAS